MPAIVSAISGVIIIFCSLLDISTTAQVILVVFTGGAASVYMYGLLSQSPHPIVPIEDAEDSVFEDVDPVENMLNELEEITILVNELSAKQIETSRIQTEDAVSAILTRYSQMHDAFVAFLETKNMANDPVALKLRQSLSDMMVSFQFQDRTSQILHHVSNSLEIFNDEIKSIQELRTRDGQPEYDKASIINKMTAGFSTQEQHELMNSKHKSSNNNVELF